MPHDTFTTTKQNSPLPFLIFQLSDFFNIYIVAWVFVAAGESWQAREYSIVATHGGLLIVVACLVAKHRLQGTGLVAPQHVGSSQTKD